MRLGRLEDVEEEEPSVDELRKSVFVLKQKLKKQTRQILAWKLKFAEESRAVVKLNSEKQEYLQSIQAQLLVFESHLRRSRSELESVVQNKDDTIRKQHQLICALSLALLKREGQKELYQILPGLKLNKTAESEKYGSNEIESENNIINRNGSDKREKKTVVISSKTDFESLNDSDSAIMMEDNYDSLVALPSGKGEAKVMRSVSDALEIISRGVTSSLNNNKFSNAIQIKAGQGSISSTPFSSSEDSDNSPPSTMNKFRSELLRQEYCWADNLIQYSNSQVTSTPCSHYTNTNLSDLTKSTLLNDSNCTNRSQHLNLSCSVHNHAFATPLVSASTLQPEVLESHESNNKSYVDLDSDATLSDGHSDDGDSGFGSRIPHSNSESPANRKSLFGSYEKLNHLETSYVSRSSKVETIQVTYNRVMSNHRSVTKPKDVKYKRINKAKSRSLEELRGKLKLFDGKQAFTLDVGVSDA